MPITTVQHYYVRARSHTRLNGTRWETLDEFAAYLGKEGKAEVEPTAHGFNVTYLEKDPDVVARQKKESREKAQVKDEEEKFLQEVEERRRREIEELGVKPIEAPSEVDLEKKPDIKFTFAKPLPKAPAPLITQTTTTTTVDKQKPLESTVQDISSKSNESVEDKKRKLETDKPNGEAKKPKPQGTKKPFWIIEGIVVKVMNKQLGDGKYYKQKGKFIFFIPSTYKL